MNGLCRYLTGLGRYMTGLGRYLTGLGRYLTCFGRYLIGFGWYLIDLGRYLTGRHTPSSETSDGRRPPSDQTGRYSTAIDQILSRGDSWLDSRRHFGWKRQKML